MQHGGEQQVGAPVFGGLGEHLRCRQRGRFVSSEFAAGVGVGWGLFGLLNIIAGFQES